MPHRAHFLAVRGAFACGAETIIMCAHALTRIICLDMNAKCLLSRRLLGLLSAAAALTLTIAPPATYAQQTNPKAQLETSLGKITLELDAAAAPITVQNFIQYANDGFFDGLIFHRVIPGFMVQGGGLGPDMRRRPTRAPIKNEAHNGLKNSRGTVAMARTRSPDSATAQFFINLVDNSGLDQANSPDGVGYAVFGKVTEGMDIVDAIAKVKTTTRARSACPSPRCCWRIGSSASMSNRSWSPPPRPWRTRRA